MHSANNNIPAVPILVETLIKGMSEVAYVFSKEGRLLTWNRNMEKIFGYSKDELKNKFVSEFIEESDKERVLEKYLQLVTDGDDKERNIEYSIRTKSGKVIPILAIRSLVVVDSKEYIIGIAINLSKSINDKETLNSRIRGINKLKDQLRDYYHKIEKMNQNEIELKEKLFLNAKSFNNKLIDNLPGIFYLYEKIHEKYYLKKWNKNYTTDLGYAKDEILNMQPHEFFTEKEFKKVVKGIEQIFISGTARIEAWTTHKNGKQIPYYYQSYFFEDNEKIYFMGVGIDISSRYALEKEKQQQLLEKQKTKEKFDKNKRELVTTALQISKTSEIIKNTLKKVNNLLEKQTKNEATTKLFYDITKIKKELENQITKKDNWEVFKLRFTEVHKDFFIDLKAKHPELTKTELKYSAYLRINLSSPRIMSILNISKEGIKKTRYRIRKKLDLLPKDSLEDYITKF